MIEIGEFTTINDASIVSVVVIGFELVRPSRDATPVRKNITPFSMVLIPLLRRKMRMALGKHPYARLLCQRG